MGIFSKLMGDASGQPMNSSRSIKPLQAERGVIVYDAELVDKLKDEHEQLLQAFVAIRRTGTEGHFARLPGMLEQFRLALLNHIALENVKFYVYLQNHSAMNDEATSFIAEVRKEMNEIARTVAKFVDTHLGNAPSYLTADLFLSELDRIGDVLTRRIALEETNLYSLYRP
ncbi:MAG TPA: hemerythrin domain-containing protein [Gallionellaceae bacterium]|nr:hemerythrin domain-containing protein [Gallionellaceae bacterium]